MKKIILIPAIAIVLMACKDRTLSDHSSNATIESAIRTAAVEQALLEKQELAEQQAAAQKQSKTVYRDRVVYRNSSTHTAEVEKRGMSKRAKYAIIGGVGGAVVGGVATKSTKGAVIGGVVGAGTGYIIGRKKDKRSGRLQ